MNYRWRRRVSLPRVCRVVICDTTPAADNAVKTMMQREFGRSELHVSPLCLGGNVFGWTVDRKTSFDLLDAWLDAGLNFVDTADSYSRWVPGNVGGESERAIGSYMLSPILRTYESPDESDRLATTNNPHVMHHAPNVSNEDVGGAKPDFGALPFVILHGPHGYNIQHVGKAEREAITREYQAMLAKLCNLKQAWCLP
jgi:hypothetical protein